MHIYIYIYRHWETSDIQIHACPHTHIKHDSWWIFNRVPALCRTQIPRHPNLGLWQDLQHLSHPQTKMDLGWESLESLESWWHGCHLDQCLCDSHPWTTAMRRSSRKEKMSIINLEELWFNYGPLPTQLTTGKKSISQKPCYHGFHTRIAGTYIDPSWSLSCWKSQRLISTLWDLVFLPVNHPDMFVGLMSILDLLPTCVA